MSTLVQVFAKYPQAGEVKTRLIPSVGEQGAADLQEALLTDLLWRLHGEFEIELWGTESAAKSIYKKCINDFHVGFRRQKGDGPGGSDPGGYDLGLRMEDAFASAFRRARLPILIGADCPSLDADLIDAMSHELKYGSDAVMVPATDGGYVALGLAVKNYQLFRGIDWGTKRVADQTLEAMFNTGIECAIFEPVQDIDTISDVKKVKRNLDDYGDAALSEWIGIHL